MEIYIVSLNGQKLLPSYWWIGCLATCYDCDVVSVHAPPPSSSLYYISGLLWLMIRWHWDQPHNNRERYVFTKCLDIFILYMHVHILCCFMSNFCVFVACFGWLVRCLHFRDCYLCCLSRGACMKIDLSTLYIDCVWRTCQSPAAVTTTIATSDRESTTTTFTTEPASQSTTTTTTNWIHTLCFRVYYSSCCSTHCVPTDQRSLLPQCTGLYGTVILLHYAAKSEINVDLLLVWLCCRIKQWWGLLRPQTWIWNGVKSVWLSLLSQSSSLSLQSSPFPTSLSLFPTLPPSHPLLLLLSVIYFQVFVRKWVGL